MQKLIGKFVENAKEQSTDAVAEKEEFEKLLSSHAVHQRSAAFRNLCFRAGNLPRGTAAGHKNFI
jgi:hypothetical protein